MVRKLLLLSGLLAAANAISIKPSAAADDPSAEWPHWRGPSGAGFAPAADPPTEWSETKNVAWKTALPGKGHSSPVVRGDHIFVTAAIAYGPELDPVPVTAPGAHDNVDVTQRHRFVVLCVDRQSGQIKWQQVVADELPHEGGHYTGSLASASPVTDGERVYAYFGSFGMYALNFDGRLIWKHPVPQLQTKHAHGEGSSPVLHDGVLVINCDHEGQSFVRAINAADGETLWQRERDEVTSWASPVIVQRERQTQVVVAGTDRIRAYDLKTGQTLWQCGGLSANVVATPVVAGDILIAASSYEIRAMLAIDLTKAKGDITGTEAVLWQTNQRTPYVPSMLVVDEHVYFLRHYQNILSRRNIHTGVEPSGPFRLPGIRNVYASPVAAANRIYLVDLDGHTLVMSADEEPQLLALNRLDDRFAATPALIDNQILLRGEQFLYCLQRPDP